MQFSSKDNQKRAMAFARLAKTAQSETAKQKFLAQQHKFETLARMAQKQEAQSQPKT